MDYVVQSSPEDFCFCYMDDETVFHYKPKNWISTLTLFTDYEGGGALCMA